MPRGAGGAIIDGELVVLDEEGRPRFELMQQHAAQVAFYAFDVLQIDGTDTIGLPYEQRRALLAALRPALSSRAPPLPPAALLLSPANTDTPPAEPLPVPAVAVVRA